MTSIIEQWKDSRTAVSRLKGAGELIPTWQQGQPQPRPNDIRRFAEDGYSKNSLIYSCIKEKATSFAPLQPVVERRDGSTVTRHRVVDLLERPNYYQDGAEFAEIMATQFDVAGNVYIEKVRRSNNGTMRRDRSGWPVQELQLIRPDYVTIEPGASREEDVFVVTIEGLVRRRIRREDIIHIHEPNLVNDFYGLSKVALIAREGDIDLSMSDFELAFFRNAGVPMGILYVKGQTTQDQRTETKAAFRRAFNGFKKWFEVLVLNLDEAKYEQLGLKQADMEGDSTRFHVESRICSVFGVPGVIVGARFAMQAGAQTPVEEAEHQFWAETMVPFSLRFARAFTMHLLPEFALLADSGAKITYDFTSVRALQEDRSRKLREVVRLVNSGWVVNQALVVCGLPAIEGGDVRILTGNQLIVGMDNEIVFEPPKEPSGGGDQQSNPDNPLEGAAAAAIEVLEKALPTILKEPRCQKCNKLLARVLTAGSEMACPRCDEVLTVA